MEILIRCAGHNAPTGVVDGFGCVLGVVGRYF